MWANVCISEPERPSVGCNRTYQDRGANPVSFKQQREFLFSKRLSQAVREALRVRHVYPDRPLVEICRIVLNVPAWEEPETAEQLGGEGAGRG